VYVSVQKNPVRLDVYTLIFATILNLFTTGGAMTMVWNVEQRAPGIRWVGIGLLLGGLGHLLSLMRVMVAGNGIVAMSHLTLMMSGLSILYGVRSFKGLRRIPPYLTVLVCAVYLSVLGYWMFVRPDQVMALALVSTFLGVIVAGLSMSMASGSNRRDQRIHWWTATLFGLNSLSLLGRAAWVFTHHSGTDPFVPGFFEFANLVTLNIFVTGCGFGLSTESEKRLRRETETLAMCDALTGLPNRRMFEEQLESVRRRAISQGDRFAVIYGDLDGFKEINDSLGHNSGDAALQVVAERLSRLSDKGIFAARLGGDEFVALVENVDSRRVAASRLKELQDAVNGDISLAGKRVSLRISCGLSVFPDDAHSGSDLVRRADAEMYLAKRKIHSLAPHSEPIAAFFQTS
jgi:diguanylate cyclase (GGDEF)-like protein